MFLIMERVVIAGNVSILEWIERNEMAEECFQPHPDTYRRLNDKASLHMMTLACQVRHATLECHSDTFDI